MRSLGELDLHLIGQGRHERLWEVLGAHPLRKKDGELLGTHFSLWAPNARAVSLIGDHNYWDKEVNPMRSLGDCGIWECFIEDIGPGIRYKFAICGIDGRWVDHSDPLARATEIPPLTASVVYETTYQWRDGEWMDARKEFKPWKSPISIYEVHLGSWRSGLNYEEAARELGQYLKLHGFTHVEFLPLTEHPYSPSWGYQVTSYFAPTSRFGNPDQLKFLIDHLHNLGIGVILDWVPAHFPKDEWALARLDGTALYEHADPRLGEHPDWGTLIFNYGRNEVRNFLVASALYWLEEFHIDGLRVDAVASMLYLDYSRNDGEWIANAEGGRENWDAVKLLQETNATAYRLFPGVMMIAEESTAWGGVTKPTNSDGLGFGFKWNMGWMHDTLSYLAFDSIHRKYHHNEITFSILYAFSENFILPLSHDEVVHGKGSLIAKMPGDRWQKMANLRALYGYMWAHPGKQLLFMGDEFAQNDEWSESKSLDWHLLQYQEHQGISRLITDLNSCYRERSPLWQLDSSPEGFEWLVGDDAAANVIAFSRRSEDGQVLVSITNFSPVPHDHYRLPLPEVPGRDEESIEWHEVLNTDDLKFGGSNLLNDPLRSERVESHGKNNSLLIRLAPLATQWFTPNF
ncbi:MAG: 1,4-alpha-glucan branching protein GlgB [Actinomycetota bacterium]